MVLGSGIYRPGSAGTDGGYRVLCPGRSRARARVPPIYAGRPRENSSGLCYDSVLGLPLTFRAALTSRRTFVANALATAASLAGCGRRRAQRYRAFLYIASGAENAIVISDLANFRRAGSIPMGAKPTQILSARGKVFAICAASQAVLHIDPAHHAVRARITVGGPIAGAALTTGADYLVVARTEPPALVLVDTATAKIVRHTNLPGIPQAIAASDTQAAVVLANGSSGASSIARVHIPGGELLSVATPGAGLLSALDYRSDGRTIFAAAPEQKQIVTMDAVSGSILARLPVPIRPGRFCTDGTGGQVFVTGAPHEDQLVIFSPYQNQIDQTLYAGRAPYGMTVAPTWNLLFLTSPEAGVVTVIDIATRGIKASIRTGGSPREILIAASGKDPEEYAFAVDSDSGEVAVIHIPVVMERNGDAVIAAAPKPVFTVFHGGADPQSAVIVPYEG